MVYIFFLGIESMYRRDTLERKKQRDQSVLITDSCKSSPFFFFPFPVPPFLLCATEIPFTLFPSSSPGSPPPPLSSPLPSPSPLYVKANGVLCADGGGRGGGGQTDRLFSVGCM